MNMKWEWASIGIDVPVMRNLDNWTEETKGPMLEIYGKSYLEQLLAEWGNYMQIYCNSGMDRALREGISRIKCPTLIIHGELDPVLGVEHAEYRHHHIKGSM